MLLFVFRALLMVICVFLLGNAVDICSTGSTVVVWDQDVVGEQTMMYWSSRYQEGGLIYSLLGMRKFDREDRESAMRVQSRF
jgi:hypothetical protein